MPTRSKSPPASLQRSSEVARLVELREVTLHSVNAELLAPPQVAPSGQVNLNAKIGRKFSFSFDEKLDALLVRMEFVVRGWVTTANAPETEGRETIKLTCAFHLTYQATQPGLLAHLPHREDAFRAFADLNATTNVWPYFREMVQSTTVRMGIPPMILPLFRAVQQRPPQGHPSLPQKKAKQLAR